jgi:hypothetical protein
MKELRLDYFLSLGLKLAEGDTYATPLVDRIMSVDDPDDAENANNDWSRNNECFVVSFAPRKNTGEQPCGDDVPVDAFSDMFVSRKGFVSCFEWLGNGSWVPKSWKPDLEALIKMQAEHDALADSMPRINKAIYTQSTEEVGNGRPVIIKTKRYITGLSAEKAKEAVVRLTGTMKHEQLIYTPEIALTHGKPEADMLCRVEYKQCMSGDFSVDTVTFKFETDKEICIIDEDGCIDAIDKEWLVAFHTISTKTELELAQEKQIDKLLPMIDFIGGDTELNRTRLVKLQENGELAEIVLPLEK